MPKVGNKHFPYTPAGQRAATVARKKKKKKKIVKPRPKPGSY